MKEGTADKILEAADRLFSERGFAGASVGDIAKAAKVHKALVFYYHESKERLFEKVLERYYGAHKAALEPAFKEPGEPKERMKRVVTAYLDFMESNHRYPRMIQHEVASGRSGPAMKSIQANLAGLFKATTQGLSEVLPKSGPLSPKHFYITLSGVVLNYYTYAPALGSAWGPDPLSEKARAERREHVLWLVDTLLRALEKA